ncbi:MAG: glutathione S-transferase [Myxococcota bacterium]|nr:glutathione S-transferase [Myxococcota bacterium]
MPEIVLHHLEYSRSTRILWLLEELGLDYTIQRYERDANFRADPALKQVHPLGKAPVLVVDGLALAESGAIMEYVTAHLADGRLRPSDPVALHQFHYWLHFAEGTLMPTLLMSLVHTKALGAVPFFIKSVAKAVLGAIGKNFSDPEIRKNMGFLDQTLAQGGPWILGEELTAADMQLCYPAEAGLSRAPRGSSFPAVEDWLGRIRARPAYQRALEKGGPTMPG